MNTEGERIEPYLLSILASRIGSISVQMANAMIKGARSSILALARDCSTAICDGSGDVLTFPAGFPVHVGGSSLTAKALLEIHGHDLMAGDAYLNNSPYHGNTHAADHTIMVPVMYDEEVMFICVVRGHQADIGNSLPTTYHATAKDVYEEGALIFPCARVQHDYKDIRDVINMCKMRIRVPDVWYGDYLAMMGAARIGERELTRLIEKYGKNTIKNFCREWHAYGKQRIVEELKKFPAGTVHYENRHDPIPGVLPDGVNVKVKVTMKPEEGLVVCDFLDNEESKPCGMNLSEATLTSAARTGILNRISAPDLPHCEGALSRIIVKMQEGSIVGKAKHPFSSSMSTTNVNDRAIVAVGCALNQLTERGGMAESGYDMGVSLGVISGVDSRNDGKAYVTQLCSGTSGGPGIVGHDGDLRYCNPTGGLHYWNSVEMIEKYYPILYIQQEILPNGIGAGKWDGAPSVQTTIRPVEDPVMFIYFADGSVNPAKGAAGGLDGVPAKAFLCKVTNGIMVEEHEELATIHQVMIQPGEAIRGVYSSSGGFGNPLERDPEFVRHRAREGWITPEMARETYGVVLDVEPELYAVDVEATRRLREDMLKKEEGGK